MKRVSLIILSLLVVIIAMTSVVAIIVNMISPNVIAEAIGCIGVIVIGIPAIIIEIKNLIKK